MITKGIIEDIVSPYEVKVRIPLLDRSSTSSLSTATENLNSATICTLPNCYMNLQIGDIVFVGFEDNTYYKAVILGHLSREASTSTYVDLSMRNLTVLDSAKLPSSTSIGELTAEKIQDLIGLKDILQQQIDELLKRIEKLESNS